MDVRMYNVDFGEAIIYAEDDEQLLVDCGSLYQRTLAYDAVKSDFIFNHGDILITHFDEDHYNGLIAMAHNHKHVRRIFLPKYIVKDGAVNYTDNYFIDQLRAIMYLYVLGKKKILDHLNQLFISLISLSAPKYDIKSIAYDDHICVGRTRLDILWPEAGMQSPSSPLSDRLRELLVHSLGNEPGKIDQIDNTVNEYLDVVIEFFQAVDDEEYSEGREDLFTGFRVRLIHAHNQLTEEVLGLHLTINSETKNEIHSIVISLIKAQNDCSVIFCKEDRILALGDASKKVVDHLRLERRIADHYTLIKAPHHGTPPYYSSTLPDADYVFISNSGTKQIKWAISEAYPNRYGDDAVFCTNTIAGRCKRVCDSGTHCTHCNIPRAFPVDPICRYSL